MKIMNNYTLNDVLRIVLAQPIEQPSGYYDMIGFYLLFQQVLTQEYKNYMKLYDVDVEAFCEFKVEDNVRVINKTPFSQLFRLIKVRYGSDYFLECEEDFENYNASYYFRIQPLKDACNTFMGILISTKDKYINLLNIYNDNISKLMDGLKGKTDVEHENHRDEDFDTDVTGKNLLNDTPTTTDVISDIEQNQFVSELSKSTAHTDNVGGVDEEGESHTTSENNTKYVMEKIKDIQDNYQKVLYEWSEEFAPLFIEEV